MKIIKFECQHVAKHNVYFFEWIQFFAFRRKIAHFLLFLFLARYGHKCVWFNLLNCNENFMLFRVRPFKRIIFVDFSLFFVVDIVAFSMKMKNCICFQCIPKWLYNTMETKIIFCSTSHFTYRNRSMIFSSQWQHTAKYSLVLQILLSDYVIFTTFEQNKKDYLLT